MLWKICSPHACLFCSYVINELIQTEKLYVEDLAQIVLVSIVCHFTNNSTEMFILLVNPDSRGLCQ